MSGCGRSSSSNQPKASCLSGSCADKTALSASSRRACAFDCASIRADRAAAHAARAAAGIPIVRQAVTGAIAAGSE
ncbi:hypothetical protein WS86_17380 [Burkholderia savannae]|uniref:Lipoprotein n=1 Tax=Burkholderia savannae TaxID=1637837 RepID=A0ABR5THJ1_9BURK|nr:hypothetical protein WS86_17380 [Burkholderia savannae]KWZ40461.1 hypothetical protein WS73_24255 [Burkholderia savannae]KWZ44385.1 hypothetical protein WS72_17050 [Burkholderia savannae]